MGEAGWLYLIWLACRPPELKPAGLGMRWADAIRLSPTQLGFLLSSEEQAKAVSRRLRVRHLRASGDIGNAEQNRQRLKAYMADLRRAHGVPDSEGKQYDG